MIDRIDLKGGNLQEGVQALLQTVDAVGIVLYHGCLQRCREKDDFFKWEIQTALAAQKPIHFYCFDVTFEEAKKQVRKDMPDLLGLFQTNLIKCINTVDCL